MPPTPSTNNKINKYKIKIRSISLMKYQIKFRMSLIIWICSLPVTYSFSALQGTEICLDTGTNPDRIFSSWRYLPELLRLLQSTSFTWSDLERAFISSNTFCLSKRARFFSKSKSVSSRSLLTGALKHASSRSFCHFLESDRLVFFFFISPK